MKKVLKNDYKNWESRLCQSSKKDKMQVLKATEKETFNAKMDQSRTTENTE